MGKSEWVEKMGGQTALAAQLFRTDGAQLKDAFKEVGQIANTAGDDLAERLRRTEHLVWRSPQNGASDATT